MTTIGITLPTAGTVNTATLTRAALCRITNDVFVISCGQTSPNGTFTRAFRLNKADQTVTLGSPTQISTLNGGLFSPIRIRKVVNDQIDNRFINFIKTSASTTLGSDAITCSVDTGTLAITVGNTLTIPANYNNYIEMAYTPSVSPPTQIIFANTTGSIRRAPLTVTGITTSIGANAALFSVDETELIDFSNLSIDQLLGTNRLLVTLRDGFTGRFEYRIFDISNSNVSTLYNIINTVNDSFISTLGGTNVWSLASMLFDPSDLSNYYYMFGDSLRMGVLPITADNNSDTTDETGIGSGTVGAVAIYPIDSIQLSSDEFLYAYTSAANLTGNTQFNFIKDTKNNNLRFVRKRENFPAVTGAKFTGTNGPPGIKPLYKLDDDNIVMFLLTTSPSTRINAKYIIKP